MTNLDTLHEEDFLDWAEGLQQDEGDAKRKTLPDLPWIKISITMKKTPLTLLFAPLFVFQSLIYADWPSWRGPSHNGAVQEQFAYPSTFNSVNGVKWVIDLAGSSASTPIILGDKVFLSGTHLPEEKDEFLNFLPCV